MKNVQTELKSQGFFYNEITGVNGPETVAAVKRFQIRNGLEVTGTLSKETLDALGIGGGNRSGGAPTLQPPKAPARSPAAPSREQPSPGQPGVDLRRDQSIEESDRTFLKKQQPSAPPRENDEEAEAPAAASGGRQYTEIFARTPYAAAPLEVQQSTLRRAQRFLSAQGAYREAEDGVPGPDTEEAILSYQRRARLPLTGRLDMETLSTMRLLPGSKGAPPMRNRAARESTVPRGSNRTYRGIWVE